MDTSGSRVTGPTEMMTITGYPGCGYYHPKSAFYGPRDGGAGVMEAIFGTAVIGGLTSGSTAESTMDSAISEPVSGAAIGTVVISFITAPAGMSAPAFTMSILTTHG